MAFHRYFFSPQPTPEQVNKYSSNFFEELSKNVKVVNRNRKPSSRSIDFFRYAFKSEVMILNWPEDVIHLRFGFCQLLLSVISLILFKLKGGTLIWVCHNKKSHKNRLRFLSTVSRSFFEKISDYIIVHSQDAINYFSKEKKRKVFFLNHPTYDKLPATTPSNECLDIDVLIWGNITPYKGLNDFIENYRFLNSTFNVTIIGKAEIDYHKSLLKQASGLDITIMNQFLSDDDLYKYFQRSRVILLPYLSAETFSSGVLIHSLMSRKIIIGPAIGNFVDLAEWGAILTYQNSADLYRKISFLLNDAEYYNSKLSELNKGIEAYYYSNSWDKFVKNLLRIIGEERGIKFAGNSAESKLVNIH